MPRQTRSTQRQPSAGPSRRPGARRRAFNREDVIELTDSDDDPPVALPPRKRQKVFCADVDTIGLTSSGSSEAFEFKVPVGAPEAREQSEATGENAKENPLADLTNEQNRKDLQSRSNTLDVPVISDVVAKTPVDPLDLNISRVLEVVPDVQPEHARSLLTLHQHTYGENAVAMVLHVLLEQPYPKVERNKGKRKREDGENTDEQPAKVAEKDYGSRVRIFEGGEHYVEISFNQLTIDFPRIPVPHIRQSLQFNNSFYAPTYLMLHQQLQENPPPFKVKSTATRPSGKGKHHDAEFDREFAWLLEFVRGKATKNDGPLQDELEEDEDGECEGGIECGCCFSTYRFDKMVQCPDAHLFCKGCMRSYVENLLGQHDPNIKCMDQGGCKLTFADAELKRFLSSKLLDLYERIKQAKEIEAAGIDGLEECPFCEYKVVIENPEEKLFRCERDECGAVSCRECKKLDHLPQGCKEAEEDKGLNARHKVEEAMTEALMRNCPKCKKAFIKEDGCNKMCCPHCRTLSCYVCRQVVKGYDHFDSRALGRKRAQASGSGQKCLLWDSVQQRHEQEVAAAREKAIKEAEEANPNVDKKQLEVDFPETAETANVGMGQDFRDAHRMLERLIPLMPVGVPQALNQRRYLIPPAQRIEINAGPPPRLGPPMPDRPRFVQQPAPQHVQLAPLQHVQPRIPRNIRPPVPQYGQPLPAQHVQVPPPPPPQVAQPTAWPMVTGLAAPRLARPNGLNMVQQQLHGALRHAEELHERVRQRWVAQHQQLDAHMRVIRNAHAPIPFAPPQIPAEQPFVPHSHVHAHGPGFNFDFMAQMQAAAPVVQPHPVHPAFNGFLPRTALIPVSAVAPPAPAPQHDLRARMQVAPAVQPHAAPAVQGQAAHRTTLGRR